MENFDIIIFIHCNHRIDRYQNIKLFISKFNIENYLILKATYLPDNGAKGCSHSHYRAMNYCFENNLKNALILEDDYFIYDNIIDTNNRINDIIYFNNKKWDVIMFFWLLNGMEKRSIKTNNPYLRRITHKRYGGSSTLSYAVNIDSEKNYNMFKVLRDMFKMSYDKLSDKYNHNEKMFKTDAIWLREQYKYEWYICVPKIGEQIETKSDIHCWG